MKTLDQYRSARKACREIFFNKTKDYGTSWRVLRLIAIVDQIYIKAWRIRTIQESDGVQHIPDTVESEFRAIVNYGYIALIQSKLNDSEPWELPAETALKYYDEAAEEIEDLMLKKNHDYGEAWRNMSQQSFVDLILTKLLRIRQINDHDGRTLVSEGVEANFCDMVNYALFALIKIGEQTDT